MFEESDQAQAIKALQAIDPRFNMEKFLREAREYIIPELMDAYLKGDSEILREWCSEAVSWWCFWAKPQWRVREKKKF